MANEALSIVQWAVGAAVSALGGSAGAVKLFRQFVERRARAKDEEKRVKLIREDNEVFKREMRESSAKLETGVQRINADIRAMNALDDRPMMQTCDEGKVQWINPAFTREFGWTLEDMKGAGWINNAIEKSEQHDIREQWRSAVESGDVLHIPSATVMHKTGAPVGKANIEAQPKKCVDEAKFGWQFVLRLQRAA